MKADKIPVTEYEYKINKAVGLQLKKFRIDTATDIRLIALALDSDVESVYNMERGEYYIDEDILRVYARVFGADLNRIFDGANKDLGDIKMPKLSDEDLLKLIQEYFDGTILLSGIDFEKMSTQEALEEIYKRIPKVETQKGYMEP